MFLTPTSVRTGPIPNFIYISLLLIAAYTKNSSVRLRKQRLKTFLSDGNIEMNKTIL